MGTDGVRALVGEIQENPDEEREGGTDRRRPASLPPRQTPRKVSVAPSDAPGIVLCGSRRPHGPPHQCHQSWMRSVLGSSPWPHVGWRAPEAWGQAYQGDVGASCGSIRSACGVTGPGVWETVAPLTVCRASPRCRPCGWGCGWRHPPQYPERVASVPSPACCLMSPRSHSECAVKKLCFSEGFLHLRLTNLVRKHCG